MTPTNDSIIDLDSLRTHIDDLANRPFSGYARGSREPVKTSIYHGSDESTFHLTPEFDRFYDAFNHAPNAFYPTPEKEKSSLFSTLREVFSTAFNRTPDRTPEEDQFRLFSTLMGVYLGDDMAAMRRVFGSTELQRPIIATLTPGYDAPGCKFDKHIKGVQLRFWYDEPRSFKSDHIDSAGKGLLVGLHGDERELLKYMEKILPSNNHRYVSEIDSGVSLKIPSPVPSSGFVPDLLNRRNLHFNR